MKSDWWGAAVVTPFAERRDVAVLAPSGAVRLVRSVTRSARDACVVDAG